MSGRPLASNLLQLSSLDPVECRKNRRDGT